MNAPMRSIALSVIFTIGVVDFVAAQFTEGATPVESQQWHSFDKTQLSEMFLSEGASFADFDSDGIQDVVSGTLPLVLTFRLKLKSSSAI